MGAVVKSKLAARQWLYTNGTLDVLLGYAYHYGQRGEMSQDLIKQIEEISGDYIIEKWPNYKLEQAGSLHYIDLDKLSYRNIQGFIAAIRAGIDQLKRESGPRNTNGEIILIGEELLSVVVSAAKCKVTN